MTYVKKRLTEIRANPALGRRPKRASFRKRVSLAAQFLTALGNDKRLLTVMHVIHGERTVSDLLSIAGGSQHSLSQHLALLVERGILESRAEGTWRYYSCKSEDARAIIRLLDELARNQIIPTRIDVPPRP
ncbi:ArsR/SmtB family transcription factor [Mesorhizobium sp. BH1-1-4]|uniref:ArsR/SmtB family transcription factor n=1 Tax=Mesorhizobium sp. BH1-1-4 TaxID=2876662 RepID=UPI001CD0F0E8|nr:metalloregulator ArsR/SmtB family transcription factor [Mesorhizobium sp. BH1-1-4]MBZ9993132.1 metalloregulator ArsR/SmtB family transcription factor [Mesorhizobium sp. BH1-1-4]